MSTIFLKLNTEDNQHYTNPKKNSKLINNSETNFNIHINNTERNINSKM